MKVFLVPELTEINENNIDWIKQELTNVSVIAVDTETTELIRKTVKSNKGDLPVNLKPFLFSIAWFNNGYKRAAGDIPFIDKLWPILKTKVLVFHNAKFDMHVLANYGLDVLNIKLVVDTLIWARAVEEGQSLSLDALSKKYKLGPGKKYDEKKMLSEQGKFRNAQLDYASLDAYYTYRLYELLNEKVYSEFYSIYVSVLWPILKVLFKMERDGVLIDVENLQKMEKEAQKKLFDIETKIIEIAGYHINVSSTQQLSDLLFNKLGLKPAKFSDRTGAPSTDVEVLNSLVHEHPIVPLILEYRTLEKYYGTYLQGILGWIALSKDRRLHTTFNLGGTRTWRLSSSSPNLQNIPAKFYEKLNDLNIRSVFIAPAGYKLIDIDYAQVELRILAHWADDDKMISLIKEGIDLHSYLASKLLGIPYEDFVEAKKAENPSYDQIKLLDLRRAFKSINFGVVYGMGPQALAKDVGISVNEATTFMRGLFTVFPGIQEYVNHMHQQAKRYGWVPIMGGLRRFIIGANSKGDFQARALRQAQNTPIQGSAAFIMFCAMIEIDKLLDVFKAKMLLQVHDELLFEVPEENAEQALRVFKEIAETAYMKYAEPLKVPLIAEGAIGNNWAEIH